MGLFGGLFNKDIKNTSNTTNVDNSRVDTLTDSLNTNLNLTRAESKVYNNAFDAIDSFNTVNSYEFANIGGGPASIPTLDFTGIRSLFTNPADLSALINANKIDADPNANKYNFNFDSQTAAGNEFLEKVQGLVKSGWDGLASVTPSGTATQSNSTIKYAIIAAALVVGLLVLLRFKR